MYVFKYEDRDRDLIVVINNEEYKIAEMFGNEMEFEEPEVLNELYGVDVITQDCIEEAKNWVHSQKV